MRIAYVRVSTEEQNEARQREALKQYRIEKWFCEKRSAKDTNRPQLEAMLEFARSGDTIYIHDFSRLARNTQDLLRLVQRMQQKEIQLISCQEQIDTATATGKMNLNDQFCWSDKRKESRLQKERSGIRGGSVFSSQIALNYYMEGIGITKLQNLKLQGSWRLVARR